MSLTAYLKSAKIVSIILIVIFAISYIIVLSIKNKNLQKENQNLNLTIQIQKQRIIDADNAIDSQNKKIEEYAIDKKNKESMYNKLLIEVEKYRLTKKNEINKLDNISCNDKLNIIVDLQKEFVME